MSKVSPELLQKIKDATNLVDVVSEHVVLRKSGSNFSGLCPFHAERSPSFSVSETKQVYHCHGCKRGGDLFAFVMEMHHLSFPEAIEELSQRSRVALPKEWKAGSSEARDLKQERLAKAFKLNRFAAAFFHQALGRNPHIQDYFNNRAVTEELHRSFYLGGAPAQWDALAKHLIEKQAPVDLAMELGLIRPSQKSIPGGPGYFDLFRNRAIFPILDHRGRVAGFGGRILPAPPGSPDVSAEGPKYLNSPESVTYQKSKLAYGFFQAAKHVRERDEIILVEGYFDVLGMHAAGFSNTVASSGTSLSLDHLNLFKKVAAKVVLLFDGDKAGVAATEKAMETGLEAGQILYGARMPAGLDPDQLVLGPNGKEAMQAILRDAKPLLDTRIDDAIRSAVDSETKSLALKKIATWLEKFQDPIGKELRVQAVLWGLGVSRQLIDQAMGGRPNRHPGGGSVASSAGPPVSFQAVPLPRAAVGRPTGRSPAPGHRDRILLAALTRGGEFAELFMGAHKNLPKDLPIFDLFVYLPARDFVARLVGEPGLLEQFQRAPETVLGAEIDAQVRSIVTEALVSDLPKDYAAEVRRALDRACHRIWAQFSQKIRSAMSDAETKEDAGLYSELSQEYLDARRRMEEFNHSYDEA